MQLETNYMKAFRDAFEYSPVAGCVIRMIRDANGTAQDFCYEYTNRAMAAMAGMTAEQMQGKTFGQIHGFHDPRRLQFYDDIIHGRRTDPIVEMDMGQQKYMAVHGFVIGKDRCSCVLLHADKENQTEIVRQQAHVMQRVLQTLFSTDSQKACADGRDHAAGQIQKTEQCCDEEMPYPAAVQNKELLGKCRVNITTGLVDYYVGYGTLLIKEDAQTYEQILQGITELCVGQTMKNQITKEMNAEKILDKFFKGENHFNVEYQRRMRDGRKMWVRTVIQIRQQSNTGNVMCFLYTYDIDEEKTISGIVNKMVDIEYEFLGLISLETGKFTCYRYSMLEERIMKKKEILYAEALKEFIEDYILPDCREEAAVCLSLANIQKRLERSRLYNCAFSVTIHGEQFRKKWQMAYLDDSMETIILIRSDISSLFEQQQRQQENLRSALMQAEQAQITKNEFLSQISREIRTPMNAIIGMSALAAQSIGNDAEVADCIEKIGESTRYLLSLLNDILDMARIENGKMLLRSEQIPFFEFISGINAVAERQTRAKQIHYQCDLDGRINGAYFGDAMKLQQILVNLLIDAIKETPRNGRVTFSVTVISHGQGRSVLRFCVNYTGREIPEEDRKKIFEPFEQREDAISGASDGTGLELAIARNLTRMMGGNIAVNNIEGEGSEFAAEIPLKEDQSIAFPVSPRLRFEKLCALIVDDDTMLCEQTAATLQELGMLVDWATSGMQAIDRVQTKWDNRESYDFILISWRMPDLDGLEISRQIRRIVGQDATIFIMTTYEQNAIEKDVKQAGINSTIGKPLFKSTLISAFEKAIGQAEEARTETKLVYNFKGRRILLAEDHPLNAQIAEKLLQSKGCTVEIAENGLRAVEMYTAKPVHYYDAILMDIRMPIMDGLQAANNIRHRQKTDAKTIPIIAMTANAFEEDMDKSKAAGMNDHLAKPIEPELLYRVLYRYFYMH